MEGKSSLWMEIDFQRCCIAAVCVICLLVVIVLKSSRYFRGGDSSKSNSNNDTASGPCKFPDCIRCRRHKDLLTRARTKLTYYEDNNSKNSTSAAALLLTDVLASYRKLSQNDAAGDPGKYDISVQNPLVFHVKGIRAQPEWSVDDFPGLEALTDNLEHIQSEFWELRHGDTYASYWKENETPSGRWGICHLLDQGVQTKAVAACPFTWQVVSRLPAVMTNNVFGNVAFSVVEPGTRIAPHFGPSNIRIRCHLGLYFLCLLPKLQTYRVYPGLCSCCLNCRLHEI